MIRAVLVDDEPPARVRMRQLLDGVGDVSVVGEAGNADEAREVIRNTRPDLLFLDVEMPEVRGTALAASLPEPRPFIVFATAFDNYGLDAIAVDATDYLLKPVSRAKLAVTLDRVRTRLARLSVERDIVAASEVQSHMWPGSLPRIAGFDCAAASLRGARCRRRFLRLFPIAGETGATGAWALLARRCVRQGRRGRAGGVCSAGARQYRRPAGASRSCGVDGGRRSRRARHDRRRAIRDRDLRRARRVIASVDVGQRRPSCGHRACRRTATACSAPPAPRSG